MRLCGSVQVPPSGALLSLTWITVSSPSRDCSAGSPRPEEELIAIHGQDLREGGGRLSPCKTPPGSQPGRPLRVHACRAPGWQSCSTELSAPGSPAAQTCETTDQPSHGCHPGSRTLGTGFPWKQDPGLVAMGIRLVVEAFRSRCPKQHTGGGQASAQTSRPLQDEAVPAGHSPTSPSSRSPTATS